MHHLALNRSRPHDRHFDDEVVEIARPEARQHGHLGARFDLKDADGVGAANHVVHRAVLARHRREIELARHPRRAAPRVGRCVPNVDQSERPAYRAQHAEPEHVHFEQSQRVEIVLVPLDDGALRHRRVLDGHELIQAAARDHETAHVLREMAREPQDLRRERHQAPRSGVARIEPRGADALGIDALTVPPLHAAREPVDFLEAVAKALPTSRSALRGR